MGLFNFGKRNTCLMEHPEKYDTHEKEVIVLTMDDVGSGRMRGETYWSAGTKLLGYIDVASGRLVKDSTWITWDITDAQLKRGDKKHGIKKETCYRLLVRESLPFTNFGGKEMPRGRQLFVVKVLEAKCSEPRLKQLLEEYRKVVNMALPDGTVLTLDKRFGSYKGDILWCRNKCSLDLSVDDENSQSADSALKYFERINAQQEQWDKKAKEYAAEELVSLANDWLTEAEESGEERVITKEEFEKDICLVGITVEADGSYEFVFDDGDFFAGHVIVLKGDSENGFTGADIEG